jgi:hypothetical protein
MELSYFQLRNIYKGLGIAHPGREWFPEVKTSVVDPAELARASNSLPELVVTVAKMQVWLTSSLERVPCARASRDSAET